VGEYAEELRVFKQPNPATIQSRSISNQNPSAELARLKRQVNAPASSCARKDDLKSLATKAALQSYIPMAAFSRHKYS
jgi:hypothetical protein